MSNKSNKTQNTCGPLASDGYGPLQAAGEFLALPPGFQYSVVSYEGGTMDDGFQAPKAMDGLGAFPLVNGNLLLIRNLVEPVAYRFQLANAMTEEE